ncbi:MAG: hypothetical protein EOP83_18850 [Verrucomicrobiaceae bacterium]|nr:MAG: hypothetical protein EOP83_18850 [Verrucomicrobiaceae bacterium]
MYANKINGKAFAGEFLGTNLQFYTLTTGVNIKGETPESQAVLDKVIEVISLNGQPVILGTPNGTGPYTMMFANEHTNAWGLDGSDLVAKLKLHVDALKNDNALAVTFREFL